MIITCSLLSFFILFSNTTFIMGGELQEKGVSNSKAFRRLSDRLDNAFWPAGYKEESKSRAAVHGLYHGGVGALKKMVGNQEGANAEFKRSKEQFDKLRK